MKTTFNRIQNRTRLYFLFLLTFSFILTQVGVLQAKERKRSKSTSDSLKKTLDISHTIAFDGNRIYNHVNNSGQIVHTETNAFGLLWPSVPRTNRDQDGPTELMGDKSADYSSGHWIIGMVNDTLRSACIQWGKSEYIPGKILPNGERDDASKEKYRVYKIMKGDGPGIKDWDEWPVEDGAPVNDDGTPKLIGDQTLWWVMNDLEETRHTKFETKPIGLEVQITIFGFNESGPLGDIMFVQWKIIHKGTADLDNAYFAVWDDGDLGWYLDDHVGADTTLDLGYYYNGDPDDLVYGTNTPAMGFDFLRGPESPKGSGNYLKMTSFAKYYNPAPPGRRNPVNVEEAYNYITGYWADGSPYIDRITGLETKFAQTGDPVTGTGDLDFNPGDRRSLISAGPFTMAVGDTQIVMGAKIMAPGADPPSSVSALRYYAKFAQTAFENDFDIVRSPPIEELTIRRFDQEIFLNWFDESDQIESFEKHGYQFQGYIVYQGQSMNGPWERIAIYDKVDNIGGIWDEQYDEKKGVVINAPVVAAKDVGLQRYIRITEDAIFNPDQRLSNYRDYYFAVTTYCINLNETPKFIESAIVARTVAPSAVDYGTEFTEQYGNLDTLNHISGTADGTFIASVVDPSIIPDANYKIIIKDDHSMLVEKNGSLYDTFQEFGPDSVSNYTVFENAPVVDGLQFHLIASFDAPTTFNDVEFTTDADTSDGDLVFAGDPTNWGYSNGLYNNFGNGVPTPSANILRRDLQLRFTGITVNGDDDNDASITQGGQWTTQWPGASWGEAYLDTFSHAQLRAPFELWDIENNRQINFVVINRNADRASPYAYGVGDPATPGMEPRWRITGQDYIIPIMTDYDPETAETTVFAHNDSNSTWVLFFARRGAAVWSFSDVYTVFYDNPLIPGQDEFSLTTTQGMISYRELIKKEQLKKINIVPNPYWAHNPGETHPINRFIRLTNLPGSGVTIRIFTLAGELVKVINDSKRQEGGTFGLQYANWDLRNDAGIPVASGVYLIHFEVEGVGNVVRKAAVFLPEERLRF